MDQNDKDLDYFIQRFTELTEEAREHGLHVAILVENIDPISQRAGLWRHFNGTRTTSIGLLQDALMDFAPRL